MQLCDLVKPMDQQTDEELLERLQQIRHNRNVVRPAATAHKKRAAKKGQQGRMNKVESLLDGMSEAERAELIALLGEGNDG